METTETLSQYELERGKPMPSKNHSRLEYRLTKLLLPFEDRFDILIELSVEFAAGKSVPDLCLYPKLEYDWEKDEIKMTEPPVTTIEIVSPTQAVGDLVEKIRAVYFPSRVQSAWILIPPLKTVSIFYPALPTDTFSQGTLTDKATGVTVDLAELFK